MEIALDGTYEPYPTRFPPHLNGFVLIDTKIWWASGLHGNSPLAPSLPYTVVALEDFHIIS